MALFHPHAPRHVGAHEFRSSFCDPKSRPFILIAAILASGMGFIDGTIVAIAMPAIRDTLGASLVDAQWISNSYLLALSALVLVGGAVGDQFGLVRVFAIGIALFVASSIICALAPTAEFLILARAAQGIGAALMVPGSLAIISRAYPKEDRGRAIGIWASASAITMALGPVLGGAALTLGGPEMWRWIFAVNLPLGGATLWLIYVHAADDPSGSGGGVDFLGAALAALGLGLIAWAMTGSELSGAQLLAWGCGGAVVLVLFVFWEGRAAHPMMPLRLFSAAGFGAANLATFFIYFALTAVLFFLPMTIITGWGISEFEATLAFIPLTVFVGLMSSRTGEMSGHYGAGVMIGAGGAIVAVAYAALAIAVPYQNFWGAVIPIMCLMGFGMGLVASPLSVAVMGSAPDELSGAASGFNNAVARLAGLVAVAAMGTVAAIVYARAGGSSSFGIAATAEGHVDAMDAALIAVSWITAGLAALGAGFAWFGIPRPDQAGK